MFYLGMQGWTRKRT